MSAPNKYPYEVIDTHRQQKDYTWDDLAEMYDAPSGNTLRSGYYRWRERQEGAPNREGRGAGQEDTSLTAPDPAPSVTATLTREDIARITSLDDLLTFFEVDTEMWEVRDYRVNKWEQASGSGDDITITPLYQVRANLIPRIDRKIEQGRQVILDLLEDAKAHAPTYEPPPRRDSLGDGDPVLALVAILDPHFGLKAFGAELGGIDYDLKIAEKDYGEAAEYLLSFTSLYNTEKIGILVGHDGLHVDAPGADGRVGGVTTKGTPQDTDTRLGKMFTAYRRAVVRAVDKARLIASVEVRIIPGNHDRNRMYDMGEVLAAWYRNDSEVEVFYGPRRMQFMAYGTNTLMLTHGEETLRKRDNLAQIMADECPAEMWVSSDYREGGYREIVTGHLHKKLRGGWYPTGDMNESRGIRLRGMPGITAQDAWHAEQGYRHQRAAGLLVYRRSGGVAGEHEFTL